MDIFRAATILKQLHMIKGSDIISETYITKEIESNFRLEKPETESHNQFYSRFVQDFALGKYTAYLCGREARRRFYLSPAWLSLKKHIMDTHEKRCVLCGTQKDLSVDHKLSRYKHPELELDPSNCQILCRACNIKKSWK